MHPLLIIDIFFCTLRIIYGTVFKNFPKCPSVIVGQYFNYRYIILGNYEMLPTIICCWLSQRLSPLKSFQINPTFTYQCFPKDLHLFS